MENSGSGFGKRSGRGGNLKHYAGALLVVLLAFLCMGPAVLAGDEFRTIKRNHQQTTHQGQPQWRALVIGIGTYESDGIKNLKTPVADARAVAEILKDDYGFQVTTLLDEEATWAGIDAALRGLSQESGAEDSVLIYYGGHGDLDPKSGEGWWYPYDARLRDRQSYLKNRDLQQIMKRCPARHVLLVSDSCYAGALFGDYRSTRFAQGDSYHKRLFQSRSRLGLTAGGNEPVLDKGGGGHSIFAYHFLSYLKKPDQPVFSAGELFRAIAPVVTNNSAQKPEYLPVLNTGHERGEFIFIREGTDFDTFVSKVIKPPDPTNRKELVFFLGGTAVSLGLGVLLFLLVRPRLQKRKGLDLLVQSCEQRDVVRIGELMKMTCQVDESLIKTAESLMAEVRAVCLRVGNKSIFVAPGPRQGIGRGDRWALAISDPHVSRKPHCWLSFSDQKLVLSADGGVISDGEREQRMLYLEPGDSFTLGKKSVARVVRFVAEQLVLFELTDGPRAGNSYVMGCGTIPLADILGQVEVKGAIYWEHNRAYLRQDGAFSLLTSFSGQSDVVLVDGDVLRINGRDIQVALR